MQNFPKAFPSPLRSAIITLTGLFHSRKALSGTFTLWQRPKAPCPVWNSGRLKRARSNCARKFFAEINRKIKPDNVKYDCGQQLRQVNGNRWCGNRLPCWRRGILMPENLPKPIKKQRKVLYMPAAGHSAVSWYCAGSSLSQDTCSHSPW